MRELKFRMWDKVNNKFIDPFRFEWNDYYKTTGMVLLDLNGKVRIADYSSGNGDNSASSVYSEINNPNNYVIQQYTGLNDKNGNLIFEGDIVQYNQNSSYDNMDFIAKWGDDKLGFIFQSNSGEQLVNQTPHLNRFKHLEVVGNIFEHENLLK